MPASINMPEEMTILDTKAHPAVKAHIDMLQNIISRMAKNSATCKSWAVPLVTAILMLALEKGIVPATTAFILICWIVTTLVLSANSKIAFVISSSKSTREKTLIKTSTSLWHR